MSIYALGCSYTQYFWPTWADIIIAGHGGANLGYSGFGNTAISNRAFHLTQRVNLQPTDTVIVAWSTVNREDRSKDGQWLGGGNVYNNKHYNEDFLMTFWDDSDALNKTLMQIYFVNEALRGKVNFLQTTMLGTDYMFDEYLPDSAFRYSQPLLEMARTLVNNYDWLRPIDRGFNETETGIVRRRPSVTVRFKSGHYKVDHHPTPLQHLFWVKETLPELLTPAGEALAREYHAVVYDLLNLEEIGQAWGADPRNTGVNQNHVCLEKL